MDPLFANHLHFMAGHRGSVQFRRRDIDIRGPLPELCSFVPATNESKLPAKCTAVRHAPWSGSGWDELLPNAGFKRAEVLNYMEYNNPYRSFEGSDACTVHLLAGEADARVFAETQAEGFATGDKDVDAWWKTYFLEQATANIHEPDQLFYLGYLFREPVTCTLVVRCAGVSGIYAVATKPKHRRSGVSTAVLEHVRRDAMQSGFPRLILQANSGSYAEGFYSKLGFQSRYLSPVWRRTA